MSSKHLTHYQQNFTRLLIVCVDLIKLVLTDILESEITPVDLYNAITSCVKLTKTLRPEQTRLCYLSPPNVPDYKQFDVSLLYTLIRNLCPRLKPTLGWGKTPSNTATRIGDDVERLRAFRNEIQGHCESSSVDDRDFKTRWTDIKTAIKRLQTILSSPGCPLNYEKELEKIEKLDLGCEDMEKYKLLLEGMMYLLKKPENEGVPKISTYGENIVTCGGVACFKADVESLPVTIPWSVTWQRVRGSNIEEIKTNTEKYTGSNDRQLMIHKVAKEDEGQYQAVLCRQNLKLTSNSIFLEAEGDLPKLHTLNVSTEVKEIILHYEYTVSDISPEVNHISWAKNGQNLSIDHLKYVGGGIDDRCLTITSPTAEDAGRYTCTVMNAVGGVSESLALDIPSATISIEAPVYVGSQTQINSVVAACPPPERFTWQKSSDSVAFEIINMDDPRYFGSKQNSSNPVLTITKTDFDDKLYYRLLACNKIGECISNTLHLNVTGPPNISDSQVTNIQNRSVTLTCDIFLYENSPAVLEVCWMKNNEVLDITGSGGKLAGGSITNPSLVINNVNEFDAGSYQCKASNAVGSTLGNVIVLGIPNIGIKESTSDDSKVFEADLRSIPTPTHVEWNVKNENTGDWTPLDRNSAEYRGTTDSIPLPVLVVNKKEHIKIGNFQIKVKNFIGKETKLVPDADMLHVDNLGDSRVNTIDAIFQEPRSASRFINLLLRTVNEVPEKDLDTLKRSLEDSFQEMERLVKSGKENRGITNAENIIENDAKEENATEEDKKAVKIGEEEDSQTEVEIPEKEHIPSATISIEGPVYVGSQTQISSVVAACPPPEEITWQKSSDSVTFETINMDDPRYFGSKQNSSNPVLIISKTAFDDKLYYRLLVWNKIGECISNTLHLNVTGSPPNISNSQVTNIQNRSVTLTCDIFLYENSPAVLEVCWMKNNEVLDIIGSGGKLAGGSVSNPSLVINNVNEFDAGSYQCKSSNAVGSTLGNIIVLGIPNIDIKESTSDDSKVFEADLWSIPTPTHVEWNVKNEDTGDWAPLDRNSAAYRGTIDSLPHPVLVVNNKEHLKIGNFQIKGKNFIGTETKLVPDAGILHVDNLGDGRVNTIDAIFREPRYPSSFINLLLRTVNEVPEKDLDTLKRSLEDSFQEMERLIESGKENRGITKAENIIEKDINEENTTEEDTKAVKIREEDSQEVEISEKEQTTNERNKEDSKEEHVIEEDKKGEKDTTEKKILEEDEKKRIEKEKGKGKEEDTKKENVIEEDKKGNKDTTEVKIPDEDKEEIENYAKDDEFQKRFQQYLEEGSVDVCPISQIIIVGENGVGKTTLLYRLQGKSQEEINEIKSTRGIEYHTKNSGFIVTDHQLILNKEGKSNLAVSPESVLAGITKAEKFIEKETKEEIIVDEEKMGVKISEEDSKEDWREIKRLEDDTRKSGHSARNSEDVKPIKEKGTRRQDNGKSFQMSTEEQVFLEKRKTTKEEPDTLQAADVKEIHPSTSKMNINAGRYKQPTADENTRINTQAKYTKSADDSGDRGNMVTELMNAIERGMVEEQNITMKLRRHNSVVLKSLDFAGQGAYYASHQAHMRKDAIYVIVFDASRSLTKRKMSSSSVDELSKRNTDEDASAADDRAYLCDRPNTSFSCWSQADYIQYWLNTIRVHGGSSENIILVGTHKDSITNWKEFKSEFDQMLHKIAELLPKKRCEVFIDLSRMNGEDEKELGNIKDYVCKVVSKSETNSLPAKWMKYEGCFEKIKSQVPVIGIDDLLEIIDKTEAYMWDVEIHDMLRYFHENGSILFFNMDRLREIIIVDIQWFVDCFKHIITDEEHAVEEHGIVDTDVAVEWNLFWEKGLLNSNLYKRLLNVKAFNLSQEHREILGQYQQKLGMMLQIKGFEIADDKTIDGWYVPCVNTEEFHPDIKKYGNTKASSILCFRFEGFLPLDLFGRMVVLCLSSGKWDSARRRLYKEGAHLLYCGSDENKVNPLEVYLSTSRSIITVQILNVPKPEIWGKLVKSKTKHGEVVKMEIQQIIQELLRNFYACSKNCETGFLCSKGKGYKESSVQHFIPMNSRNKFCHACGLTVVDEMKQASEFWNFSSGEHFISNKKDNKEGRGQRQWIATCCQAYLKVREQILFEKGMEFGTFYISLLTKMDSKITKTKDSHLTKDDEALLETLDSLVDIGLKLKHLRKISLTTNRIKEENIPEIKDIACTLNKILLACDDKHRRLRRDLFFSWTDIVEDIQHEDIDTIPEISLNVPSLKIGATVNLKASVDVGVYRFAWLKMNHTKKRFKMLQTSEPIFGRMTKDSFRLTKFSEDNEGQYQLIVATKRTVGRKSFQLQADEINMNAVEKIDSKYQQQQSVTWRQSVGPGDHQNDSRTGSLKDKSSDINSQDIDGYTKLHKACRAGNNATVQLLLNDGADINLCGNDGVSPLFIACQNGHDSAVQLLLNNGADINLCKKNGVSPVYIACDNGHDSTVQLLLNNGADINVCTNDGISPLLIACYNGHDNMVQLLLNNGADTNLCANDGVSPVYIACQNGHDSTVQFLLNNGADINLCANDGVSPVYIACQNGHDSTVQLLLNNGADINYCENDGVSPVYIACQIGHDSTVQLLLNNGADINLCEKNGVSPVYIACQNGHDSTVQLLLNNGADINLCKKNGVSPVYIACQNGHDSTVQLLLNNGADINLCEKNGISPVYIACYNGHDSMVQLLLNNGADINLCRNNGDSPIDVARRKKHKGVIKVLCKK